MQDKFNFYDLVSYVIPGAINTIVLWWFIKILFGIELPFEINGIGESLLFLLASYLIGHISAAIFEDWIKKPIVKKWNGYHSEQFLSNNNSHYSSEMKKTIRDTTTALWNIADTGEDTREVKRKRQEIFYSCYKLLIHEGTGEHSSLFNSLYHFYLYLLVSLRVVLLAGSILLCKSIIMLIYTAKFCHCCSPLSYSNFSELWISVGLILISLLLQKPIEKKYTQYAINFVDAVYYGFLARDKKK
jgi:hypothetical protein